MRAMIWNGVNDLRVETVPDPEIIQPHDAIVRVTMSSVCGSDLHLLGGYIPAMKPGDIIGHEFMGEVVDTGREVSKVRKGDRVIVISILGCGQCEHCRRTDFSCCDNTNPKPLMAEAVWGQSPAGIIGYSHALGGWAGSHANYIRVPFADVNVFKVPEGIPDEKALFVSDACPTGFMGADLAGIQQGDIVAVWGCGGVGQMAMQGARILGAERVIAIDRLPERLRMASERCGAEVLNYEEVDIFEALTEMTGGRGPDRCIDCVGMEAHGTGVSYLYDLVKQQALLTERIVALREAIRCCRKGGTVSVMGVYGSFVDKFPMGAVVNKALTIRSGQQHGQRYVERLFGHIERGEMDPSHLLTHLMPLEQGPRGYDLFKNKKEGCIRAVFTP
ncbi:MAG: glutathione-dependent formaldehyde dehydrogenase [Acetobacteraceae bacterium]|nr:MAG: glutathione-dependent formaldehyde dehydrogenase [Acetobacteraceae bacterium]